MKHFFPFALIMMSVSVLVLPALLPAPEAQAVDIDIRIGGGGAGSEIPPGRAYDLDDLEDLVRSVTRRLIYLSGILAVFFIILSGIMYMYAGDDESKVDKAKGMLKSGIIGSAIIFGVGVILLTVEAIVMGDFFGI